MQVHARCVLNVYACRYGVPALGWNSRECSELELGVEQRWAVVEQRWAVVEQRWNSGGVWWNSGGLGHRRNGGILRRNKLHKYQYYAMLYQYYAIAYFDFKDDEHDSPISLKYASENSGANSNEWDDWENAILPDLIPIRVSAIQGKPRPLGFTRSSFGADMFLVPRRVNSREEAVDIKKSIATSFHSNVLGNISTTQYKPHFNTLFKKVRKLPYKLLPQLESWPPSQEESAGGNEINWAKRMKVIMNCPFMMPKYRQLVYWITTKTLMDGKRLKHMPLSPAKGVCSFCNVSAASMHIFKSCTKTLEFWTKADHLGEQHWAGYKPLDYEHMPTILTTYDPISLFHMSGLLALTPVFDGKEPGYLK